MTETKHPHYADAVYKQALGKQTEDDYSQIQPEYRGAYDPEKGTRITCAMAARLDWSHDGGPDDIVGYWLLFDASKARSQPIPEGGEK